MFSLTYASSATAPFSTRQLTALLEVCQRNNKRRDVTGMLLYSDGNFMQVLEGAEAEVRAVHGTIAGDSRHRGLITLLQGPCPERQFADWSMGFRDLNSAREHSEGYSEFLNLPLTGEEFQRTPSKAQKLLLSFKQHLRAGGA